MAHAFMGRLYGDMGETVLSRQSMTRAFELRDRASDKERFFIVMNYQRQVAGNLEKAHEAARLWSETYPRDVRPHGLLSGMDQELGRYAESVAEAQKAIDLDPDFPFGYLNLGWSYIFLERVEDAVATMQRAAARNLAAPELLVMRYYVAFLRRDSAGMQRRPTTEGRTPASRTGSLTRRLRSWPIPAGWHRPETCPAVRRSLPGSRHSANGRPCTEAGAAVREAFFGNAPEADRYAIAARQLSDARDVEWGAAFAWALSGKPAESRALANDLEKRFPEDTHVRFRYVPMLRALDALNAGAPARALDLLQTAAPFDLAAPGSWGGFFGNLYSVYLRGTAYLALHRGAEAAAEFGEILNHPGLVLSDPVGDRRASATRQSAGPWLATPPREKGLRGLFRRVERGRSGHPHSRAGEGGIRPAALTRARTHRHRLPRRQRRVIAP